MRKGNTRGGVPSSNVPKYVLGVLAVAAIVVIAYILWPKTGGGGHDTYVLQECSKHNGAGVSATVAQEPKGAVLWLDDSGSMQGYSKDIDFTDAISNIMGIYPNTIARTVSKPDTINDLVNALRTGGIQYTNVSQIADDLKNIVAYYKDNRENLVYYVSDGILSGSDEQIRIDNEYNVAHKKELRDSITAALKGSDISMAVYRFECNFNGTYYCYDNSHNDRNHPLRTRRSYFIIVAGGKERVAHFKKTLAEKRQTTKTFKLEPTHEVHFIENKRISTMPRITGGDQGQVSITEGADYGVTLDINKIKNYSKSGTPVIKFEIPLENFRNYVINGSDEFNNTLVSKLELKIDNTKQASANVFIDSKRKAIAVTLDINALRVGRDNVVELSIPYFIPSWIDNDSIIHTDDDRFMLTAPTTQTFLFDHFMEGILSGILPQEQQYIYSHKCAILPKNK